MSADKMSLYMRVALLEQHVLQTAIFHVFVLLTVSDTGFLIAKVYA
jgi:hypothetical protein